MLSATSAVTMTAQHQRWAVDFGYYLYDKYGDRPGLLTAGAFSRALDPHIAEHPVPTK